MHGAGRRTLSRFVCFFELAWMLVKQASNCSLIPKHSGCKSLPGIKFFFSPWIILRVRTYGSLRADSTSLILVLVSPEDRVDRRAAAAAPVSQRGAACLKGHWLYLTQFLFCPLVPHQSLISSWGRGQGGTVEPWSLNLTLAPQCCQ